MNDWILLGLLILFNAALVWLAPKLRQRQTFRIDHRLDRYGPATCPIDGNHIDTVFTHIPDHPMQLVCRNHPGHPLFEEGRGGHDSDDPIRYPTLHHGGV